MVSRRTRTRLPAGVYGYLVEGANDLEKIVVFVGGLRSGKGTNARIIEAMFRGSLVKPLLSSFVQPFGAESLTDASIALFTDARLGKNADTANAIEKMLAISGRDSPGVPRKYKSDFAGTIRARIVMLCNELPYLPDASGAMGNRFVLVRFLECFLGKEDPDLSRRLTTDSELSGIFNFALEGLRRLRAAVDSRCPTHRSTCFKSTSREAIRSPISCSTAASSIRIIEIGKDRTLRRRLP